MNRRSFISNGIMAAFAGPLSASVIASQHEEHRDHTVSVTADGINWFTETITAADLSGATYNRTTRQRELTVSMEIPDCDNPHIQATSSGRITGIYTGLQHDPTTEMMCMFIVAVIIIIVAGVIIYQLVKLCRHVLPNKKDDNS